LPSAGQKFQQYCEEYMNFFLFIYSTIYRGAPNAVLLETTWWGVMDSIKGSDRCMAKDFQTLNT
jgi:ABC-type arginine transport system permease subunit